MQLLTARKASIAHGPWWMLPVFLLSASPTWAALPDFPQLTGRVVDQAQILTPPTRRSLTEMLAQCEQATGRQVVVVTLESLQGYPIEDFGYQLGRKWGIGQKGKNTGALLIIAPNERKVRIEVGYGLEGTLTDAASRTIIEREILPSFRAGDFNGGVIAGTAAIVTLLGGSPSEAPALREKPQPSNDFEGSPWTMLILLAVFMIFVMARNRFGQRSVVGRGGGVYPPIFFPGGGFPRGRDDMGGGGFFGGGGSFGGGGASGSW